MPMAGKMETCLPWPGTKCLPPTVSGGNGLPLAKIARPFDQVYASSAVHSDRDVGLEYGKMIGRSLISEIASITFWLNSFGTVLTPMMPVGLRALIAAPKSLIGSCSIANGFWNSIILLDEVMRPLMSKKLFRLLACSIVSPSMAIAC